MKPDIRHQSLVAGLGNILGYLGLLLMHAGIPIFAQEHEREISIDQFHHTSWTVKDGAPGQVTALAQTTDGYLWLGTQTGLFRFDGVRFERYEPPGGQQLPSVSVSALFAPPSGGLWIGFRYGAASFLDDGRLSNYLPEDGFSTGTVFGFAKDRTGVVWAATFQGLVRLQGTRWERVGNDWGYSGKRAWAVYGDREGALWVATDEGMAFLPPGERRFHNASGHAGWESHIAQAADGTIWISGSNGSVRPFPLPPLPADQTAGDAQLQLTSASILFDRDGSLWIGSPGDGIRRLPFPDRLKGRRIARNSEFAEAFTEKDGLSADYVGPVLEDREGNIWFGTSRGLDRFRHNNLRPAVFPSGSHDFALGAGDRGVIWAGTKNRPLMRLQDQVVTIKTLAPPITCAHRDADGMVWLGGPGGIWRVVDDNVVEVAKLPAEVKRSGVQAIAKDRDDALWIALNVPGIFRLAKGAWTRFEDWPVLNVRATPLSILTDPAGRIWLGFSHNRITLVDGEKKLLLSSESGLDVGNVTALYRGAERLWAGGEHGLNFFDGTGFRVLKASSGAPFSGISGIVETPQGELWLNGARGVVRVPADEIRRATQDRDYLVRVELFDFLDGLQGTPAQFRPLPTAIRGTDSRLWFTTAGGVASIDPARIMRNPLPPTVLIRTLNADGKQYALSAVLPLPVRTANLQIAYTALSLSIPERVQFRYKLEGLDHNWQDAGSRREAFYTNLQPGSYRFRVIAANNDGVWNQEGASLSFDIPPSFFQTWWFRTLCAVAGLGLFWLLYLLRLRQIRERLQGRLQERLAERERIARDLHDTLLQGVQGLILRFQAVAQRIPPAEPARALMEKTLERADEVLVEGRDRVRDLRESTTVSGNLPEALAAAGREFALDHPAGFSMIVQGAERPLHPIVCEEAYRIGREALANAFAHARAQQIEVEVAFDRREFRIRVRDDGQGIDAATLGAGGRPGHWGLSGMRERAHKIGARLTIWSGAGAGTELELKVPAATAYRSPSVLSRWLGWRRDRKEI